MKNRREKISPVFRLRRKFFAELKKPARFFPLDVVEPRELEWKQAFEKRKMEEEVWKRCYG